jgi:hypothetical protein
MTTPLAKFLKENDITASDLAREAGHSRKHIGAILTGRCRSAGFAVICAIVRAASHLAGRRLRVEDLFEVWKQRD